MNGVEWPVFPSKLLEAPADEWGRLPGWGDMYNNRVVSQPDDEASSAQLLLTDLEDACVSAQGGQDRAKALETIQTFLVIRRIRLVEDLMLLTLSLGEEEEEEEEEEDNKTQGVGRFQPQKITKTQAPGSLSGLEELRRELAVARSRLPRNSGGASNRYATNLSPSTISPAQGTAEAPPVSLAEGSGAEQELRAAAGLSAGLFFATWAKRFGHLLVPLGGGDGHGGQQQDQSGRGVSKKDDREIQAARDIERDTLSVNGVLVVGSEGYAAVVGRVKRELGRLADPVSGPDGRVQSTAEPQAGGANAGVKERRPLRPSNQLENFSKLVLKAANRTESGGLSFDAINRIVELCPSACDGSVMVVPDSSKAEPLGITIAAEGFIQTGDTPFAPLERVRVPELRDGVHAFGICAHVEAVTVYSLYSADMETVHLRLRATFRNSLRLPLSPFSDVTCEAFADVGYRGEAGDIEIEVVGGTHCS